MPGRIKFLFFYYFSWILFFESARLVFVLYNFGQASTIPASAIALSFFYGIRMDASVAAYILLPVCLFLIASIFLPFFRKPLVYRLYSFIVILLMLLLIISDLEVYRNWGFRIDATPLRYLDAPKEAWASVSHLPIFWILLAFVLVFMGLCYLFHFLILRLSLYLKPLNRKFLSAAGLAFITVFLIIPVRGGIQQIPINQSSVYFSRHNFANVSAINAAWNFIYSLSKNRDTHNPYRYLDTARAKQIADSLYHQKGNGEHILTTSKPNVIIIVWESFTEKAIHASIGGIQVTPRFNELKKEGIYFSQIYASGDRTDKGIAAVLSGYPALNNFSIIHQPKKSASLPGLPGLFKSKGYHTSFYYGGESEFANLKSYLLQSKFDRFTDKNDYSTKDQNSKWGAHDGIVAQRILNDIEKDTGSFFTSWLTLSSHEPFEIPVSPAFSGKSDTRLFMNSLHYTDEVIYQLVQKLKQRPDWNNTIVIIVADHGHPLIEPSTTVDNRKIPMLWLGGALKDRGIINRIGSQLDLATSLEQQLDPGSDSFPYSRNLFDSSAGQWAYFSFNDGFGLVQPGKTLVYDNAGKQISFSKGENTKKDLEIGMALQQFFYDDYLKR